MKNVKITDPDKGLTSFDISLFLLNALDPRSEPNQHLWFDYDTYSFSFYAGGKRFKVHVEERDIKKKAA